MVLGTFISTGRRRPATILVIEDEDSMAELIEDSLSSFGYKIVLAKNGAEGLSKIQETEPDIILCDRLMPMMSGSELLERLRNLYPQYSAVPFIFLTALTDPREKASVEHLLPYAYMDKPLNFDLLRRTVEQALGR